MAATMQERLDEVEQRYEQLTKDLARPEVASDPGRLRDLGKKHAELQELVSTYRAYRDALRHAEDARTLARQERDREMAEFLRGEEATAAERAKELESRLELLLLPKDPHDEKDVLLEIRAGTGGQEAPASLTRAAKASSARRSPGVVPSETSAMSTGAIAASG